MSDYRTLFSAVLVQDSALSVGGNEGNPGTVDDSLCRDGLGRPLLRGTTLTGALVATARKLVTRLPESISKGAMHDADTIPPPSLWNMFNAHLIGTEIQLPEARQGVGIRQDTGASAEGVLFDMEALPRGTRWRFLLEVNTAHPAGEAAERLAAAALREWARGRCWIGRSVARGLGWLKLEELRAYRLDTSMVDEWPDSGREPTAVLSELEKNAPPGLQQVEATDFPRVFAAPDDTGSRWHYLEIEGTLSVGERQDGYGLDAVSVGGHAASEALVLWEDGNDLSGHYLAPEGQDPEKRRNDFRPDAVIVMTRDAGGTPRPFLPGSGLRGPLRHALSRRLRAGGAQVRDPNVRNPEDRNGAALPKPDPAEKLFGNLLRSATLLVRDAYLENSDWQAAWLQHHAEDEFAASVFGGAKFDRVALVEGTFQWKMVIEAPRKKLVEVYYQKLLRPVLALGEAGQLPLGANTWCGLGWPLWRIDKIRLGRAGEDAHDWQQ